MSKPLTWPQWLDVIAQNITIEKPYICCHIDGNYVDDLENPSKAYIEAVTGPDYASFRVKLENEIIKEVDALNAAHPYDHSSTLSRKLGYLHQGGVKGRQDWLRSLKNI
jgi:hypothetical protein